jgi:large subunit ribosomal protein L30
MAKIKITQTGSPIRRDKTQRATLVGLGLNKIRRTVEVEEDPRGSRPGPQGAAPGECRTLISNPGFGPARPKRKRVQRP